MALLKWMIPPILSLLTGGFLVQYLTQHPLKMSYYLGGIYFNFFALLAAFYFGFSGWDLGIAALLSLTFFGAGYTLTTQRFLAREDPRPVPELTREKGDPGQGHTAVIYFTHGEPETYDPIGWINQFNEFDEQGISFVPLVARPFFCRQLRNKYLKVGRSDHRRMHHRMLHALEETCRAEGDSETRFYMSFLDDNPRPDAAVIQALNEGASRIIVAEVFLTISNHTAEGEELIKELHVEETYGVSVCYTGPLYDSQSLQEMFVQRVNQHRDGTDKTRVGVLLVGHGQPDEWDVEWATETEQETSFRVEVMDRLAADGYLPQNLSLAWMEFKSPEPAQKVEEFVRQGVEKVFYFSAAISADAIHSQYDVPALVEKARVPGDISLINLGAWNDDPFVIQAIKEKIDRCRDHSL